MGDVQERDFSGIPSSLREAPLRELYRSLRSMPEEEVGALLPVLSPEQRQLLLDIDLWDKDSLDIHNFEFWIETYIRCGDERIVMDFCQSISFQLYLKSRFNISTFDSEDPHYPSHNNYFLTEDNLLLFEFHQDYPYVNEMKYFLLTLYSHWGVEKAYSFLFKMVSEPFSSFQEYEYEEKNRRLSDQGFVDYYESLEIENPHPSWEVMDVSITKAIREKTVSAEAPAGTGMLPVDGIGGMKDEFERIGSEDRKRYLSFNLARLVNSSLTFHKVLKNSEPEEWEWVGDNVSSLLSLGRSYLRERFPGLNLGLEHLDFGQIYKIGNTLIRIAQKRLMRVLSRSDVAESFRGIFWNQFLQDSLERPCRMEGDSIANMESYRRWVEQCELFFGLYPFIKSFHDSWKTLLDEGRIQSSFYLNYTAEEIDFEAILISSFANHQLKTLNQSSHRKMGLTWKEFRSFTGTILDDNASLREAEVESDVESFLAAYGMGSIPGAKDYVLGRLRSHLEDVDYSALSPRDYKHLGGPVLFADGEGTSS